MASRFFIGLAAFALGGCSWASQPGIDAGGGGDLGPPSLEIGGADDSGLGFVSWRDGTAKPTIIRGPQGGQHVWVSAHAHGLWKQKILLTVNMHDEQTGVLVEPGEVSRILNLTPYGDFDAYEGFTAYVSAPCAIANRLIRVEMLASDLYGVATSDSAVVTPQWSYPCGP